MRHLLSLCSCVVVALPTAALAQTVESILQKSVTAKSESLAGCDTVKVDKSVMGISNTEYFEKIEIPGIDGAPIAVLRQVPFHELQNRQSPVGAFKDATPEQLEEAARVLNDQSQQMGREYDKELQAAGMPKQFQGLLNSSPKGQPWLSPNPQGMLGSYSTWLSIMAESKKATAGEDGTAEPKASIANMADVAVMARLVDRETVDGAAAFHIRADDLNHTERSDGQEITIQSMSIWIHADRYVPLRMKTDGVSKEGKESRAFTIERHDTDYRTVPGSSLYEPYRTVMRVAGVMNDEQQAEMQQAQQKIAEFELQMQQMPESQRRMIMERMGPQMEMMKKMASGGGIEMETVVQNIQCNPRGTSSRPDIQMAVTGGESASVAAGSATTSAPAAEAEQVEIRPYYIDEKGIGVLRYWQAPGPAGQYFLVINGLSNNAARPREILVGAMGPYKGPHIAIYIGDLNMMKVPLEQIEIELYQDDPYRPAVRFRPEVLPAKAEGMEDCGKMSPNGSCSKTKPADSR